MRYVIACLQAIPGFVAGAIWIAVGLPLGTILSGLVFGCGLGVALAMFFTGSLERKLLLGQEDALMRFDRRGGIGCFVVLIVIALAGALLVALIGALAGETVLRGIGFVICVMFATKYISLCMFVYWLERKEGRRVFLTPGGIVFDD